MLKDVLTPDGRHADILRYPNGNRAILFPLGHYTYQIDIQHARGVLNPSTGDIADYISGLKQIEQGGPLFIVGATKNGACPANCMNCPFANSVWEDTNVVAQPITPSQLTEYLEQAVMIAQNEGVLKPGEEFGVRGFGAGDPSYYTYLTDAMVAVSRFERCTSSGWSTIARKSHRPEAPFNVLRSLEAGVRQVMVARPDHKLKTQFSIWDTRLSERLTNTGADAVYSLEEIAHSVNNIKDVTNRRPNLVFVLKDGTHVDGQVLQSAGLTPDLAVITLRPMDFSRESPKGAPMTPEEMIRIYENLGKLGYDVAWIPPTPPVDNLPPIELSRLSGYATLGL